FDELPDRSACPCIVQPERYQHQVGMMLNDVFWIPQHRRGLTRLLVICTARRDQVRPQAAVDHLHRLELSLIDESGKPVHPAELASSSRPSGGCTFAERPRRPERLFPPVALGGKRRALLRHSQSGGPHRQSSKQTPPVG